MFSHVTVITNEPYFSISGRHVAQQRCPHPSKMTGYRRTLQHTGHSYCLSRVAQKLYTKSLSSLKKN